MTITVDLPELNSANSGSDFLRIVRPDQEGAFGGVEYKIVPDNLGISGGGGGNGIDEGLNLGTGFGIFHESAGGSFQFKSVAQGQGINLSSGTSTVTIGASGLLPLSGSEMSGSIAMQDNVVERPEIKDYSETLSSATSSGSTYTIDLEQGNIHKVVLNTNCTFSFTNPPPADSVGSFTLIVIQSSEGSKSATWPGAVDWASGTAPTLTDAANASDIFTFMTHDGGNQWFGFLAGGKMG